VVRRVLGSSVVRGEVGIVMKEMRIRMRFLSPWCLMDDVDGKVAETTARAVGQSEVGLLPGLALRASRSRVLERYHWLLLIPDL